MPHPLPLKGVVTRGIRKQREYLGHVLDSAAVEKREDLRLSSEVVRWHHRVAHSKSTKGKGEGRYLPLYFKRLLKKTSLDRPRFRSCLARAFWVS